MDINQSHKLLREISTEFEVVLELEEATQDRIAIRLSHDDYTVAFVMDIDTESSDVDLWLDYPEDGILLDIEQITGPRMTNQLKHYETQAERLASSFRQDRNIAEFIQIFFDENF